MSNVNIQQRKFVVKAGIAGYKEEIRKLEAE